MTRTRTALGVLVATLGVVLIAALIVGRPVQPSPTPSAAAVPPASTASAAPTTTATASAAATSPASPTYSPTGAPAAGGYGYIVIGGGGLALMDESGKTVQQHACGVPARGCGREMIAVSIDGRRVAFWGAEQSRWALRVFETATPANVRTVVTMPDGFEGLGLAWATDSRGLLYAAQTVGYGGIRGGAGKATISGVDATTPAPAFDMMPTRTDGAFYRPLAWDRTREVVSAVTSGEGGFVFEYAVKVGDRFSATRAAAGEMIAWQVEASPDATRILGVNYSSNTVHIWPVADFGAQVKVSPGTNAPRISGAQWRTSNEVAWSFGDRLDLFIPQSDSSRTVYRAPDMRLVAMRPDGTGALVASGGQPNVSVGLFIVDIERGTAAPRTSMDVAQVVVPRGVVLR